MSTLGAATAQGVCVEMPGLGLLRSDGVVLPTVALVSMHSKFAWSCSLYLCGSSLQRHWGGQWVVTHAREIVMRGRLESETLAPLCSHLIFILIRVSVLNVSSSTER